MNGYLSIANPLGQRTELSLQEEDDDAADDDEDLQPRGVPN